LNKKRPLYIKAKEKTAHLIKKLESARSVSCALYTCKSHVLSNKHVYLLDTDRYKEIRTDARQSLRC